MIKENSVVQFKESHNWCGSFGIVEKVEYSSYLVGVPIPMKGIAYIRANDEDIEYIGKAAIVPGSEEE